LDTPSYRFESRPVLRLPRLKSFVVFLIPR